MFDIESLPKPEQDMLKQALESLQDDEVKSAIEVLVVDKGLNVEEIKALAEVYDLMELA